MSPRFGELTVFTGCMFSAKSARLVEIGNRLNYARRSFVAFKPVEDRRQLKAAVGFCIESRFLRDTIPAVGVRQAWDMVAHVERECEVLPAAVIIDEVQFFSARPVHLKHIRDAVEWFLRREIDVYAAGLDLDYRRMPWTVTATLLAMARRVEKLSAVCTVCQSEAHYTQRLTSEGQPASWHEEVVKVDDKVDDKGIYHPRCGYCHEVAGEHRPESIEVNGVLQPSVPPVSTVPMTDRERSGTPRR